MHLTTATVQVAQTLLVSSESPLWGRAIGRRAGIKSGVVHPILERLLKEKWVSTWRESGRRYYQVTPAGRRELEALLVRAKDDTRFTHLFSNGR